LPHFHEEQKRPGLTKKGFADLFSEFRKKGQKVAPPPPPPRYKVFSILGPVVSFMGLPYLNLFFDKLVFIFHLNVRGSFNKCISHDKLTTF
jgi:hypothetical protein